MGHHIWRGKCTGCVFVLKTKGTRKGMEFDSATPPPIKEASHSGYCTVLERRHNLQGLREFESRRFRQMKESKMGRTHTSLLKSGHSKGCEFRILCSPPIAHVA